MDLLEVVEKKTGARMSRSPKPGDFKGVNRKGIPEFFTYSDVMGTTLFNEYATAAAWIVDQGLSLTHEIRPIAEDRV